MYSTVKQLGSYTQHILICLAVKMSVQTPAATEKYRSKLWV